VVDVDAAPEERQRCVVVALQACPAQGTQAVAVLARQIGAALDQYVEDGQMSLGRSQNEAVPAVLVGLADDLSVLGEQVLDNLPLACLDGAQQWCPRFGIGGRQ